MANSTIKLYFEDYGEFFPLYESNFLFSSGQTEDNETYNSSNEIEHFLTGQHNIEKEFQYVQHRLNLQIKVDLSQEYNAPLTQHAIRYVSIKNSNESRTYYYYVLDSQWRAVGTTSLTLRMDVLNTFQFYGGQTQRRLGDYRFGARTRISREHKDRFITYPAVTKTTTAVSFDLAVEQPETQSGYSLDELIKTGEYLTSSFIYRTTLDEITYSCYIRQNDIGSITLYVPEEQEKAFSNFLADAYSLSHFTLWVRTPAYSGTLDVATCIKIPVTSVSQSSLTHETITETLKEAVVFRQVDHLSEGISPTLYKQDTTENYVTLPNALNQNWYMLYTSNPEEATSSTNPVNAYIIPEKATNVVVDEPLAYSEINPADLTSGVSYLFPVRGDTTYVTDSGWRITNLLTNHSIDGILSFIQLRKLSDTELEFRYLYYNNETDDTHGLWEISGGTSKVILSGNNRYPYYRTYTGNFILDFCGSVVPSTLTNWNYENILTTVNDTIYSWFDYVFNNYGLQVWGDTGTATLLTGIDSFNRTYNEYIKMILLPYAPDNFTSVGDGINVPTGWALYTLNGSQVLTRGSYKSRAYTTTIIDNNLSPTSVLRMSSFTPSLTASRSDFYESKIYSSEFYQPVYVYDSFSFTYRLEAQNIDYMHEYEYTNETIKFVASNTLNSRFAFIFENYKPYGLSTENYDNVLVCARNNEIALFNNEYLNYIRTGYNYDVKAKNLQMGQTIVGLVQGTPSSISTSSSNAGLNALSTGLNFVSNMYRGINDILQRENAMEKTLAQKEIAKTSVATSDDVDIMLEYSNNRLKLCTYQCEDVMKEMLYDLFYHYGYVSNRMGNELHCNTRYWFNFIQCDPEFIKITNMPLEIEQEIANKFKDGVTFIHERDGSFHVGYTRENWELSLLKAKGVIA